MRISLGYGAAGLHFGAYAIVVALLFATVTVAVAVDRSARKQ